MKKHLCLFLMSLSLLLVAQVSSKSEDTAPYQTAKKGLTPEMKIDFDKEVYFPNQITKMALFPNCTATETLREGFECFNYEIQNLITQAKQELNFKSTSAEETDITMEYTIRRDGSIENLMVRNGDESYHKEALKIMQKVVSIINQADKKLTPPMIKTREVNMFMRTVIRL